MSAQSKQNKILLVEDEDSLAVGLEYNLTEEGYRVTRARDGREALDLFESEQFDLIILDIMLPYMDGFQVAEKIRQKSPRIPILILTARTSVSDRIHGLSLGADDYLLKPFHLQELLLRVKGMLKRKTWYEEEAEAGQKVYRFGDNKVDFSNLSCRAGDREFQLTPREAMVLKYLIDHKGQIVSRQDLLENVWQISGEIETRTVDNFIARLRKYFEPQPSRPIYIKSVRSAGYIFSDEKVKPGRKYRRKRK